MGLKPGERLDSTPSDWREVDRFDISSFKPKTTTTPQGFLRGPAFFTRVGIFEYKRFDGTTVRELRPPEEVFHPDSLATLASAPVTRDHPHEGGRAVYIDPKNATKFTVGVTGERIDTKGDLVGGTLTIMDANTIADAKAGKLLDISSGYRMLVDPTSGVHPVYGRYDAIQRRIRYNHVALLGPGDGRAGQDVALRFDGAAELVESDRLDKDPDSLLRREDPARRSDRKERNVEDEIVIINGVEFKVPRTAAQAFTAEKKRLDSRVAELEKSSETAKAQADANKAKADDLEKKLAEATDAKRFDSAVADRIALVDRARKVWKEAPATGSAREIREVVLKKSGIDVAGKSDAYVEARFDALAESLTSGSSGSDTGAVRRAAQAAQSGSGGSEQEQSRVDSKKAHTEMLKRNAESWKQPLSTVR